MIGEQVQKWADELGKVIEDNSYDPKHFIRDFEEDK